MKVITFIALLQCGSQITSLEIQLADTQSRAVTAEQQARELESRLTGAGQTKTDFVLEQELKAERQAYVELQQK